MGLDDAVAAVQQLREHAETATEHVEGFTGLTAHAPPTVRVVDRPDWASINAESLRNLLEPLARKAFDDRPEQPDPLWVSDVFRRNVAPRVAGAQAAAVLGYLSGKVLGQYEMFGDSRGQLLLVAPNIVDMERQLDVRPTDFRLWVCLHEAAHAAQFGGVSWLREHFMSEIEAFAAAADDDSTLADRLREAVSTLADPARGEVDGSSVIDLVTSAEQREVVQRLTALMTLLEGHADYVMDAVGPEVVADVDVIRRRFNRRRENAGPVQRVIRRLLGVDVKLRQYVQGRQFVESVVDTVGMDGLNQVWHSPSSLPTMDDIADPTRWIERVAAP